MKHFNHSMNYAPAADALTFSGTVGPAHAIERVWERLTRVGDWGQLLPDLGGLAAQADDLGRGSKFAWGAGGSMRIGYWHPRTRLDLIFENGKRRIGYCFLLDGDNDESIKLTLLVEVDCQGIWRPLAWWVRSRESGRARRFLANLLHSLEEPE